LHKVDALLLSYLFGESTKQRGNKGFLIPTLKVQRRGREGKNDEKNFTARKL
jgi:hypothetical protein